MQRWDHVAEVKSREKGPCCKLVSFPFHSGKLENGAAMERHPLRNEHSGVGLHRTVVTGKNDTSSQLPKSFQVVVTAQQMNHQDPV